MFKMTPTNVLSDITESTRDRILNVAEQMFAQNGLDKVSLRAVTAAAGVNVAAIHYHVGSRDELLREILVRRMTPLLEERARRLSNIERDGDIGLRVEQIVRAYIEPSMAMDCSNDNYLLNRLIGMLWARADYKPADIFHHVLRQSDAEFLAALADALPLLTQEQLAYRLEFMTGLMFHGTRLRASFEGKVEGSGLGDPAVLLAEIVDAATAMFSHRPSSNFSNSI